MRFTVIFSNGVWKVFDHQRFEDAAQCQTEVDAKRYAEKMNQWGGRGKGG